MKINKLGKGQKIYLDKANTVESELNYMLERRGETIEVYEYRDTSGYGSITRLFLCRNHKYEGVTIVRQVYINHKKEWIEESMGFDSDSFEYLEALLNGKTDAIGGEYTLLKDS